MRSTERFFMIACVLGLAACAPSADAAPDDTSSAATATSSAAQGGSDPGASGDVGSLAHDGMENADILALGGQGSGSGGKGDAGVTPSDSGADTDASGASKDAGASSVDATVTPPAPIDDPGPPPTATCPVTKDAAGFFTRAAGSAKYVGYLPAGYDGKKPVRLVVALHGCGDNAYNFATWGPNPYDTRATQQHIGISVDGASGSGGCWSMGGDDAKVLAAIDDAMSCFWVHKHEVVLAGFSSGGELAYRVALMHASRFSGLLIESSAAYDSSSNEAALIAGASWKLPIVHVQHSADTVFPLSGVQADWARLTAAGFPLQTRVTAGAHDGTSADWAGWLLPKTTGWLAP